MDHLLKAYEIVEGALEASPMDPWLSLLMGDICANVYKSMLLSTQINHTPQAQESMDSQGVKKLANELQVIKLFHERTLFFYRQAARFENNPGAFVKLGVFLAHQNQALDEAEDSFLRALDICAKLNTPLDEQALIELVSVLELKADVERAQLLKEETQAFVQYRSKWSRDRSESVSPRPGGVRLGASRDRSISFASGRNSSPDVKSPLVRALRKVSKTVAATRRKSPRSQTSSEILEDSDLPHDMPSQSATSSVIETSSMEPLSVVEDDDDELNPEFALAMERNLRLRAALGEEDVDEIPTDDAIEGVMELVRRKSLLKDKC